MIDRPSFTIGVEEEYLLVDRETRDLVHEPPPELMPAFEQELGKQVTGEFLKCQVEVDTMVCANVAEARDDLKRLRGTIARIADGHGLAIIAASTHPFAHWEEQVHTAKERYDMLARDLAGTARRMLICGMHVHVGIEDPDLRIDLMNQVTYFLPHLLALSTSSPFWHGEDMGLASSRLSVFDTLPRSGMPDTFESYSEYARLVEQLVKAGIIPDGTMIWWDVRPSARFPTLENRITDVCTRLDDAVALAALFQSVLATLFRLREQNQRWRLYPATLIKENRWRAQRYGALGELVDFGSGELMPVAALADELIAIVRAEADVLGCLENVEHARDIVQRGTSATAQRRVFDEATKGGADRHEALQAVVDFLIDETLVGV